ncbi:M13 family metallopeptidase [Williamsia maris]|uniref:Endopeptidase n=1 Tax=Williamsia maris TaxID=72806 RepID=A0ABT1HG76_9NOCA|nr:M13-type metalloendopeptidase [Williamsia maris]MCP2177247.1 putative endopeptidase [Williamsia maris]
MTPQRSARTDEQTGLIGRRTFLASLGALATIGVAAACGDSSTPAKKVTPDLSGLDGAVTPQNDLFRHVNGSWLRSYQIPADKASFSTFDELNDEAQKHLKAIIEGIDSSASGEDAKIRDLYAGYLDTTMIEKAGLTPVTPILTAITQAPTKDELTRGLAELSTAGSTGIVDFYVAPDQENATRYVANVVQSGIGLPDESYYREDSYAETRTKYVAFLATLARLGGLPDPEGVATRVMAIETAVAKGHLTTVESRDAKATYNPRTWAQFAAESPGMNWEAWRSGIGASTEQLARVVVTGPKANAAAARVWADTPIDDLRDYMRISVLRSYSQYLPKAFADARFDFFSKTLNGVEAQPERWKRGVALVDTLLGEALGKKYVAEHFSGEAKTQARTLVGNLLEAYRRSFTTIDFFSDATRKEAFDKLGKINVKIGYPDKWRDYSEVAVVRDDVIANYRSGYRFESKRQVAKLGTAVNKDDWQMTPQTVNAYYDPTFNEIVFPAAILQSPFFDPNAEIQVNYGGIGAVIGHEIGHGFDDQGSQYDGDGNLRDWWTPADRAAFTKKSDALIAQYNSLVPEGLRPDQHVDGALTVGENLADLGGLSIALSAAKIAAEKDGTKNLDLTDLFLSWARIWRSKDRPAALAEQLATDPHSPGEFRCNQVVRNLPDFYSTFRVATTDKLYLPEAQRVRIW